MSRRKKKEVPTWVLVAALLLIVGIGLMAAGCTPGDDPARFSETTVELEDGREVVCVTWNKGNAGGVSCDWAGVTR